MKTNPSEQRDRENFFSSASEHLGPLYDFVRDRLDYFESTGDLTPGELAPEDVVDAVLLRAYHELIKKPAARELGDWLNDLAKEQLRRELKRIKSERKRTVHLEANIPLTAAQQEVTKLGEKIIDSYQPDGDLILEDIFPDVDISTPEDMAAAKEELLRCVNAALARMPRAWRRALHLRHGQGLTSEELAQALDKTEPEIERILDYARQHLRESLVESGCTFIAKESATRTKTKTGANGEKRAAKSANQS
jgi:RNA polymerase sigma factor (sigma-70 family)